MPQKKTYKNSSRGKGWRGDPVEHARVGRMGGRATARSHDSVFYSLIGKKGGQISPGNFANDPDRAKIAGQKGGKARGRKAAGR